MTMGSNLIFQANFIWNTLAGLVNAAEAVILLMVVGRTNGLGDAGILTIAFAIGNLMMTIGRYGVRNYQVTDVEGKLSFGSYFTHRICTVFLMGIVTGTYLIYAWYFKGYSEYKSWVILLICLIYAVESLEDVFWGLYQKNGRIDIGAKIFIARWALHLVVTSIALCLTHQLIQSLVLGFLTGTFVSLTTNRKMITSYYKEPFIQWGGVKQIFVNCFPLFIVAFLTNYVTNAPKYAIDKYMSEADQACYGYIAMPVFVVMLFSSFVYQPMLTDIADEWKKRNIHSLQNRILKIVTVVIGLTVVCLTGAYICGIPVLSWLYATDLKAYKTELLMLMIAGGGLGLVTFTSTLLTVMRKQKVTMLGYVFVALLAKLLFGHMVKCYGLSGAAGFYAALMWALAVFYGGVIYWKLRKKEYVDRGGEYL